MRTFAGPTDRMNPFQILPLASQPGVAAYAMNGIWRYRDTDVVLEDGQVVTTSEITVGVRLNTFPVMPAIGDKLVNVPLSPPYGPIGMLGSYLIDKMRPDGMGGASLLVKAMQPVAAVGG